MTLRFAPLVATLLFAFSRLDAADAPPAAATPPAAEESFLPRLTARESSISLDGESIARGEARMAYKDIVLYADEIVVRIKDRVAVARGNVILIRGAQRLVAEEITYRAGDDTFSVGRFRVGQGQILAEGAKAEGSPDSLRVEQARLHYGEPEPLSPRLSARALAYEDATATRDTTVTLEGATLGIGTANILPLPTLRESPRNPTLASFGVRAGFDNDLGAELSITATTAVTESLRLGADLGLFSKRGVLFGPVGDYDTFGADGLGARGEFRTGFIKDQGDTDLDVLGKPIDTDRGYVEWRHFQALRPGTTLAGQLNYWSDSFVTRDFRPDGPNGFRRVQTPDTWFEAQHAADHFVVSLFTRVQANDFSVIQERLPEVRFDGLPVELGGGVYHRVNAGVAALREDDPYSPAGSYRSDRADLYYGVNRPFSPREWFSVTPVAGVRVTHYERLNPGSPRGGNFTRVLSEVGFDSKLWETSGTWNYQSPRWDINGLRHIVTPKVSWRLSPSADVGRGDIPAIDRDVFSTYLRPLGIADRRDIDRLPAFHTFRFGVDNVLQTRDSASGQGSRDLVRLQTAVDQYATADAATTAGAARDRADLHNALAVSPARWLRLDVYNRTTVQTGKMQELNTGLTVHDADVWSFRLGTHYLEDSVKARQIQEYTADYGLRLSELYSLAIRLRYDSREGQFTEQSYIFRQRLSRIWTLAYELSLYDGPRREDDLGVSVSVETKQF